MAVEISLFTVGSCRTREWFANRAPGGGSITFPALAACIRHPRAGRIIFDTGYGRTLVESGSLAARAYRRLLPFTIPPEQELPAQLKRRGIGMEDVASVFLSHFHPDHLGALREIPNVPILHSGPALRALQSASSGFRARSLFFPELLPADFKERARAIEDLPLVPLGEDWNPFTEAYDVAGDRSLLAVELPGHALGQYGLICKLADGRTLFLVADAAWLRVNITKLALPAWPVRFLVANHRAFVATLHRLHELHRQRPDVILMPSHCVDSMRDFASER